LTKQREESRRIALEVRPSTNWREWQNHLAVKTIIDFLTSDPVGFLLKLLTGVAAVVFGFGH
jgi:hypothetical protein